MERIPALNQEASKLLWGKEEPRVLVMPKELEA